MLQRTIGLLLLATAISTAPAAAGPLLDHYSAAGQAMREGRFTAALTLFRDGLADVPGSPHLMLGAAHAAAAAGDTAACLAALTDLVAVGGTYDLSRIPELAPLAALPAFADVAARIAANGIPAAPSPVAVVLDDPDLWTEGIAWDPESGDLFAGSVKQGRIVRVSGGRQTGLGDGMLEVLGLHVDAERRHLWAVTGRDEGTPGGKHDFGETPRENAVVVYDLETGDRLVRHALPVDERIHLLNDVAVAPDGAAYVTDSTTGDLYAVRPGGGLELFLNLGETIRPNGIAVSHDGSRLYVATTEGITVVDLPDATTRPLAVPANTCVGLGDGLAVQGRDLYITQNSGLLGMRVLRCRLDAAGDAVVSTESRLCALPEGLMPYTCAAGDGKLYVNGTAPFARYDEEESPPAPVIVEVVFD